MPAQGGERSEPRARSPGLGGQARDPRLRGPGGPRLESPPSPVCENARLYAKLSKQAEDAQSACTDEETLCRFALSFYRGESMHKLRLQMERQSVDAHPDFAH